MILRTSFSILIIISLILFFASCSKDTTPVKNPCPDNITWGCQTYQTVGIGEQCWFKENLNIGKYIEGKLDQTDNDTIEKYCWYDHETSCDGYGGLYQWDEMMQFVSTEGAQGICPFGWHIPTYTEWEKLQQYLGGFSLAGGKMKEEGEIHWCPPNIGATNSSGFTALPGGERSDSGFFSYRCSYAFFWSSTQNKFDESKGHSGLLHNEHSFFQLRDTDMKIQGFSVRCLRDN